MVIVITGILAGVVAVFITRPVQGYVDSVRRAELTDVADVALRRIGRDVRLALPNSLRVSGNSCIEFIMTKGGGRYRDSALDGSTSGNSLTDATKVKFDVLGTSAANSATKIASLNDYIVVLNWGTSPFDAYSNPGNKVLVDTPDALDQHTTIKLNTTTATNPFTTTLATGLSGYRNARFQVVSGSVKAVSYVCSGSQLKRYVNYGFDPVQTCPPAGAGATLAGSGSTTVACSIEYTNGSSGLLGVSLTITDTPSGESVSLFQEIHVDNAP